MLEVRKEYKFCFTRYQLFQFKNFFKNRLTTLYPERHISSLYMDTIDFKLYKDSILADVDKYKCRFRKDTQDRIVLEVKRNNQNGKFKYKELTKFKSYSEIKYLIYDKKTLYPSLLVDYKREYFKIDDNVRITIDRDINFTSTPNRSLNKITAKEEMFILEYKILDNNFVEIENYFTKNPIAYSKYNKGIEKAYKINL